MKFYRKKPSLFKRWPEIPVDNTVLLAYVNPIISDVAKNGDKAVKKYSEQFDKVNFASLKVSPDEIDSAYEKVTQSEVESLVESKARLEMMEQRRYAQNIFSIDIKGTSIDCTLKPIQSIGCYVPGGKAAYPSSVIMNVTPARVAKVEQIIVCTPPLRDGSIDPLTLVACDICMVDHIFKIGGIQAIAAMAYGTETVPKVNKIVGPGNKYVTAAKNAVSSIVAIDKPAGPSEVLILADGSADSKLIAFDLISQAEHGQGGICGLVTSSEKTAREVSELVDILVSNSEEGEVISGILSESGFIYKVLNLDEGIDFINEFAPEHLQIMTEIPEEAAKGIINAGMVLLGNYTPVSSTDYCMGVNHVLPTQGFAKLASGLTVLDFVKTVNVVKATETSLGSVRNEIKALSKAEGFQNHYKAVEARFR